MTGRAYSDTAHTRVLLTPTQTCVHVHGPAQGRAGRYPASTPFARTQTHTHTRSVRLDTTGHAHARTHTHAHTGARSRTDPHIGGSAEPCVSKQACMRGPAARSHHPTQTITRRRPPSLTQACPPPAHPRLPTNNDRPRADGTATPAKRHAHTHIRTHARTHAHTHTHARARRWAQAQRGHGCKAWRVPGQRRRRTGPRQEAQALQCRTST